MNFKTLSIFCKVYESKNYSLAATRLGLTQSAVSQQIKSLELDLNVQLFDASDRSIALPAADYLYEEAKVLLSHVHVIRQGVQQNKNLRGGSVRFGMIDVVATTLMPPVLKAFKLKYPSVQLEAVVKASQELEELISQQKLDFAISVLIDDDRAYHQQIIFKDSVVSIVPANSIWNKSHLHVSELKGEPLIVYPPTSRTRSIIDRVFTTQGIVPTIGMEMHYPAAMQALVEQGMGVALLSKLSAGERLKKTLAMVPIVELSHMRNIGILQHKRQHSTPQSLALIEIIGNYQSEWARLYEIVHKRQ